MNQPPLDRADFLRTLRRCHTEEQLFSRLTFACLAQYDEAQRPELLDDVRGAAYSLRLPAVEYKTDQWLHRCQDAIDTDRDAFLAAANAEAKRENDKMRAEQTPVGPGVLADVPLQNVDWLVPDLLPRGSFPCRLPRPARCSSLRARTTPARCSRPACWPPEPT